MPITVASLRPQESRLLLMTLCRWLSAGVASSWIVAGCTSDGAIPDRLSCTTCSIAIEDLEVIGDSTSERSLTGRPWRVVQDGNGRYFINVLDAFPMVYDGRTRSLSHFGKPGWGPGEFRHPTIRALLPGDSLLVSDGYTHHVVGPDLVVARSIRTTADFPEMAVVAWPNSVIGATRRYERPSGQVRTFVASYDMSGERAEIRDTLSATEPATGPELASLSNFRVIGEPSPDGSVWISDFHTYRLVKYKGGEALDSIMRRPPWFPGGETMRLGGPDEMTTPHMIGNWVDGDGHLWVIASKPRKDTREAWKGFAPLGAGSEVRVASLPPAYKLNQTVIEVIDLNKRRVLASAVFDGYIIDILPRQRLASFVESDVGIPMLRIHSVRLDRRE